jgi:hypothetical protein
MKNISKAAFAAMVVAGVSFASADEVLLESGAKFRGTTVFNPSNGQILRQSALSPAQMSGQNQAAEANVTAYDNVIGVPPLSGVSRQTSVNPIYGDVLTLDLGVAPAAELQTIFVTLFNSSSTLSGAASNLTTGTLEVRFYDAATFTGYNVSTPLDGFTGSINFGATPLAPGFFDFVGFDVESLDIVLPATDILVTQQFTWTGVTTGRSGSVLFDPINVGASAPSVYINAPTSNPTPTAEGFYTFNLGGAPSDFGYFLVVPEPTTFAAVAAAGLVALRRRRA